MAYITDPDPGCRASYLSSCGEPDAGWRSRLDTASLSRPGAFEAYCVALRAGAFAWQHTQAGSRMRVLWWCDGDTFLGEATIRPDLPPQLKADPQEWPPPGHLGYQIRSSARGQGHGRALCAAALTVAHEMGLRAVTLTVAVDNAASVRIVESCGAVRVSTERGFHQYIVVDPRR